jgi:8-oxo-dGTP diphosphatase
MPWQTLVKVAVAIIVDQQHRILLTQRSSHVPHGGYWEFPGGKLEANESAEYALIREIKEEVGLEILQHQYLGEIKHQYPDRSVQLLIFLVTKFSGSPACLEGQLNMKWVERADLNSDEFPEANQGIFDLISSTLDA